MRIAVLAKQIPRPAELRLDAGRLVRDRVGVETNAFCRRANARAVELVGPDGEVVVFSMGPPGAEQTLREMVACGASRGVLISDPALAGSDTLITAAVLAAAISREGPFDLVIAGAHSLDSETGHIGVQVAELLGLPFVGPCRMLKVIDGVAVATVESEGGLVDVEVLLPTVASAAERLCPPSKGSPDQIAAVPADRITRLGIAELGLTEHEVGDGASPTKVGTEAQNLLAAQRILRTGASVQDAVALLDLLTTNDDQAPAGGEPAPSLAARGPGPSLAGDAGAVWCVLDPTAAHTDLGLAQAAAAIARRTGRPVITFASAAAAGSLIGLPGEAVLLRGPDAPEDWASPLAARLLAGVPHCVIFEGTGWGRELAARLAARLRWGLVGDAVELTIEDAGVVAWKAALSGQAMVAITSQSPSLLVTVRPGVLAGPPVPLAGRGGPATTLDTLSLSRVIYSPGTGMDPAGREMARARRLIVVGAGVDPGEYGALEELKELIGAGPLGATRKVTDQGWLPRSRQVGITGRSVAPELVVSIGARGGFNHAVGFARATRVLAINIDPDAEVFGQADVGIVGDWREVVAQLCQALRARTQQVSSVGRGE